MWTAACNKKPGQEVSGIRPQPVSCSRVRISTAACAALTTRPLKPCRGHPLTIGAVFKAGSGGASEGQGGCRENQINRLLEEAGWRFFDDEDGPANIVLEPNIKITEIQIDALGHDFESTKNGYIDFLLLDRDGRPLIVLEAKSEGKNPLAAKEQARRYAREQNARFVILSNGNIHYLWDLQHGHPSVITDFPSPDAIKDRHAFRPIRTGSLVRLLMRTLSHSLSCRTIPAKQGGKTRPSVWNSPTRTNFDSCATIKGWPFNLCSVL